MHTAIIIMRWVARIASLLLAIFLVVIAFALTRSGKNTTLPDVVGFLFFVTFIAGLVLSWPREKLGITLSYVGLAGLFGILLYLHERDLQNALYLACPTTLLVICRLLEKNTSE